MQTAAAFVERLKGHRSADELAKIQRYFKSGTGEYGEGDEFLGVRKGQIFARADVCAPFVIGRYLFDRPRDALYEMARSENVWERRTAIVSTDDFIRQGDVDDTFTIAELLLDDDHDLIHKATGRWLRAAGMKDRQRLLRFLGRHAATMPQVALRYAIEHLEKDQRDHYLGMRKAG